MKKLLLVLLFIGFNFVFGQKRKVEEPPPPPPPTIRSDSTVVINPGKPFFDFKNDFENYVAGKESKYKIYYDKYVIIDSIPEYRKMTKKVEEYPPPCYKIINDSTVQYGIAYTHFFMFQTLENTYGCNTNGKSFLFYKNIWKNQFDYIVIREAFDYLVKHENNNYSVQEFESLFEEAKKHLHAGDYDKANSIFVFLGTVNEHYREASLNNIGLSFYNRKKYNEALEHFIKAIKLYPNGYLGYLNTGACYVNLPYEIGNDIHMRSYFRKAYELAPNNPNVIFNYANSLEVPAKNGAEILELKEKLLAQAIELNPNEPLFKFQLAKQLHLKAQDDDKNEELFLNALNAYDDAIMKFPNYADNYLYKASLIRGWSRNKQYPENRLLVVSVCSLIEKYKSLQKGGYKPVVDRLCTIYPTIVNNTIKNYTELLDGWEEISVAKGDLNNDGFDDIVLIARAINPSKINYITLPGTANEEKVLKNYNEYALYILFYNPIQSNYEIKEVNDNILTNNYHGYYDQDYEVQIKNGAFRLINKPYPNSGIRTRIFRWENDKWMCIGVNHNLYIDNLGNVNSYKRLNISQVEYKASYNYNTKTLELRTLNPVTNKEEKSTYTIEVEKYEIINYRGNEWTVYSEAEKIIKQISNISKLR